MGYWPLVDADMNEKNRPPPEGIADTATVGHSSLSIANTNSEKHLAALQVDLERAVKQRKE